MYRWFPYQAFRAVGLCAAVWAIASVASAHDPMRCTSIVSLQGGRMHLEVDTAGENAMTLLGIPAGTAGIPAAATSIYAPLAKEVRAGKLFRVFSGEIEMEAEEVEVEYDGEDGFRFRITYPLPPDRSLRFEVTILETLSHNHRVSLIAMGESGQAWGDGRPTKENPVVELAAPDGWLASFALGAD